MERWKAESEADVASTSESELHLGISVFSRPPSKPPSTLFENEALSANVLRNFATLRQEGRFCDVILIAGSRSKEDVESEGERECGIACHRGVLAAASPYFNAMFTPAMIESKQDRIYLQGIDSETLSALVDYMYTGRLLIDEHNVQNLLTTGSVLQLACVRDACSRFLLEQLDPSNCLGISHFAMIHGCTQLAHAATTFIHQHFSHLIRCEEFLALDKDRLIELISADRLTTNGEEKVYEAVMNWTRHDLPNRKEYIPELMDHVRLALVPQEYLTDKILIDDVWNELPNMNICRRNAGVVALGSTLFAIGGDDGTMDLSSIEMLDLSALDDISQTWTQLEVRMNRPRSYAGVALLPKLV
ncbi:Ring canal kelch protein [Toxocara canis]|uniref:Ring canal kelch protein n=1 Tax=Toxocara canis TaxID=6265 RepID=A0A0B2UXU0_TOXCA|nr:Ring canal kelch protein [Toxocara canis]